MKKILSIVAFLAISSQAADVSPLGQTIGKSTIANLKSAGCPVVDKGVNPYTNGKMFAADPKCYEVEGLLNVIFVYNPSQVLEGVFLTTKKRLFDSFNKSLSEKYKNKTAESIPFVGDKGAKWVEGDVIIELSEMHMGHQMDLIYLKRDFYNKALAGASNEANEKKKKQANQL